MMKNIPFNATIAKLVVILMTGYTSDELMNFRSEDWFDK